MAGVRKSQHQQLPNDLKHEVIAELILDHSKFSCCLYLKTYFSIIAMGIAILQNKENCEDLISENGKIEVSP